MLTREFSSTDSTSAFGAFVESLGGVRDGTVCCLKGFGSGLDDSLHDAALAALSAVDTVAWDGDWLKQDGFTSIIPKFLAERPTRTRFATLAHPHLLL